MQQLCIASESFMNNSYPGPGSCGYYNMFNISSWDKSILFTEKVTPGWKREDLKAFMVDLFVIVI